MKKFEELTEEELKNLTEEEVTKYINIARAEAGVKFLDYPEKPKSNSIEYPTKTVYTCNLLGRKVSFLDMSELQSVIDLLKKCKSMISINSDYDLPEKYRRYVNNKLMPEGYSSLLGIR